MAEELQQYPHSSTDKVAPEDTFNSGTMPENKHEPVESNQNLSDPPASSGFASFRARSRRQWLLLAVSATGMFTGFISATLLMRHYYQRGGSRRWLGAWVQTAGWPVCALAMLVLRLSSSGASTASRLPPGVWSLRAVLAYTLIGCIIALDNFLYSWGLSYLPASTAGLLTSSQLAFNSLFALFILRKRISPYIWNSIVLVTSSAVLLGLRSSSDRLPGISKAQSAVGYVVVITAAGLYGLILSLTELLFISLLQKGGRRSALLVLHVQTTTALVATLVATLGMAINRDFPAVARESKESPAGWGAYTLVVGGSTMAWQAAFLGTMGVIFLSSSLLAGVILTVVIPVGAVFAWVFFGDEFGGVKVMALLLSFWGFISYVYGGYVEATTATGEPGAAALNPEKDGESEYGVSPV